MTEDSPVGNKLFGVYRGKVVQHLTHGYCKIYIPGVYPEEWKDKPQLLPLAEQATALFGGTNNGNGVFTYPNIGSIVWCMFANNDQNYPIYFAACLGGENAFGQYELIKHIDELSSAEISDVNTIVNRHMVTSGQANVLIEENGTINASVCSPQRRLAEVKYDEVRDSKISVDHVISRPFSNLTLSNIIEHTECQFVDDVAKNNGTIQHSTSYVFPCSSDQSASISVSTLNSQSNNATIVSQISTTEQSKSLSANYSNLVNKTKDCMQLQLLNDLSSLQGNSTEHHDAYCCISSNRIQLYSESIEKTANEDKANAKIGMLLDSSGNACTQLTLFDEVSKVSYLDKTSAVAGNKVMQLSSLEDQTYVQQTIDKNGKCIAVVMSKDNGSVKLDVNGSYCCLTSTNDDGNTVIKVTGNTTTIDVNAQSGATKISIEGGKLTITAAAAVKVNTSIASIDASILDVKADSIDVKADSGIKIDSPSVAFTGKVAIGSGITGTITSQNIASVVNGVVTQIS